jgi:fucose permease
MSDVAIQALLVFGLGLGTLLTAGAVLVGLAAFESSRRDGR